MKSTRELIVRMTADNSGWGHLRFRGEFKRVGQTAARTTIAKTLKDNGVAPSPDRPTSWKAFLKTHADVICGAEFFTVDVWTKRGLVTHYVLFVTHHATRAIHIAGVTPHPNGEIMAQVGRNLTDSVDGLLSDKKFLVLDNDKLFTQQFCRIFGDAGCEAVRTAYQAPKMNAFAERFVQTVKREDLRKMIVFGDRRLRKVLREFADRHHRDRPHQSLGNKLIQPRAARRPTARGRQGDRRRASRRAATQLSTHGPTALALVTDWLPTPNSATGLPTRPKPAAAQWSSRNRNRPIGAEITWADFADTARPRIRPRIASAQFPAATTTPSLPISALAQTTRPPLTHYNSLPIVLISHLLLNPKTNHQTGSATDHPTLDQALRPPHLDTVGRPTGRPSRHPTSRAHQRASNTRRRRKNGVIVGHGRPTQRFDVGK
ncbi:MAG: integrase core domain-containing protein [Planctomycetota bacterium]